MKKNIDDNTKYITFTQGGGVNIDMCKTLGVDVVKVINLYKGLPGIGEDNNLQK